MKDIARQSITIDPDLQSIWGDLDEEAFGGLKSEIQTDGIRDPLVLWTNDNRNILVDGHNRLRVADQLHINPVPVIWKEFKDKAEAAEWVFSHQINRRNITDGQRVMAMETIQKVYADSAKENLRKAGEQYGRGHEKDWENSPKANPEENRTRTKIAEAVGLSDWKARQGEYVLKNASEEQKEDLRSGKRDLKEVYKEVKKPPKPKEPKPLEPVEDFLNRSRTEAKATETRTAIGVISVQAQKITEDRLNEFKTVYKKSEMEEAMKQIQFMIENCQRAIEVCNKFLEGSDEERTG